MRGQGPVPTPETRRDLAELLVPAGVGKQLEPESKEPLAFGVFLYRRQLLAHLARRGPRDVLCARFRHLTVDAVDALLQELREQLLLRLEVGIEGAARKAGLGGNRLDAGTAKSL